MKLVRYLYLIAMLSMTGLVMAAPTVVDVTDQFTGLWNQSETVQRNADGSLTFTAKRWGGLSHWVGGSDWAVYERLVFEFSEPTPCDVQPIILFMDNSDAASNYTSAGVSEAYVELPADRREVIAQAALQAASDATIHIKRIYLLTEDDGESEDDGAEQDDSPDADEEQDARLMVNELMQSNIDCVMDDLNDFPDSWVELFNGGTTAARLNRYRIGITGNFNEAWPLPDRKVPANGHILVYCDKVADSLHTHFRLESGKGCEVYLFRDGQLIDQVTGLKKQPAPNIAYGRETDGSETWGYQLTPTPKKANSGGVCDHDHLLGNPVFSQEGRVTTANTPLTLELSVPDGSPLETEIRYTTDGTEPTVESLLYRSPISITSTRIVRAKLFCPGWMSPRSTTQSYIFFPHEQTLPVVSIATDMRYFDSAKLGIFTNNTNKKQTDWRRPVNIEFFFDERGKSNINQLCETRVAGGASRGAAKKSMAIYANKRFGNKRFSYEFFPDQCPGLTEYKSLMLRNAGNDFDYLFMRDAICQRVMATHADIDWQAWRPAVVYINGQYYSMLNIRERANENNVYTHYDGLEDIDLIENWNDLKEGTWDAFNEFKTFYGEHDHTIAEYEERMDCKQFINLMAMNLYFNNMDFPGNNIIMWRPRTENGRWRWIAKDVDYTLGLYGQAPADYKIINWIYNPNYDRGFHWGANDYEATRLFRRLMDNDDFNREFIDHCAIYMGDFLNSEGILAVWNPMYDLIKNEYPYHRKLINEWWPNYQDEFKNARYWVTQRTKEFYTHLGKYYSLGTPVPMTVNMETNSTELDILINGIQLSKGVFDGMFYAGRNFTVEGIPTEGKQVEGWHVMQISNGSTVTQDLSGSTLSMEMPECSKLVINPIIVTNSDITAISPPSFTWMRHEGNLYIEGVQAGTSVALYDLRGMPFVRTTATGSTLTLTIAPDKVYVLKVGAKVVKL